MCKSAQFFLCICLFYSIVFFAQAENTKHTIHPSSQLYYQIGGEAKVVSLVDAFINEIGYNEVIFPYFENSSIDRFREKMIEHLCVTLDGPCSYTGDSMELVHSGMNITEADFNLTVDLLINAMTKVDIKHTAQNKILSRLAPMRKEIIYR